MQKRHFDLIANVLRDQHANPELVRAFARALATQNPQFKRDRFITAATSDAPREDVARCADCAGILHRTERAIARHKAITTDHATLAAVHADELLRDAITRIYNDDNPQLTIRHMDARASRLRHAMQHLSGNGTRRARRQAVR